MDEITIDNFIHNDLKKAALERPKMKLDETNKLYLKKIRQWIKTEDWLPQNMDDIFLIKFYHCCNEDLQQSKDLIATCFQIRAGAPEIFRNRDPYEEKTWNYLNKADIVTLTNLTPEGYRITIIRPSRQVRDTFLPSLKSITLALDNNLIQDVENAKGEIIIYDFTPVRLSHIFGFQIGSLRKIMKYLQEGHPVRLKANHLINVPYFIDAVMNVFKPYLNSDIAAVTKTHSRMDTLYKFVPKEYLPEDYGGCLESIDKLKEKSMEQMEANREYFIDESKWAVDETKLRI